MGILTREQILEADDLKTEKVPVPEWGGEVIVRTMTGIERDEYDKSLISQRNEEEETYDDKSYLDNARARLCAFTIKDENGNLVFSEKDIIELGKKSALALNRVFAVAKRLNGFGRDEIEGMIKNSKTTPDKDSGSS